MHKTDHSSAQEKIEAAILSGQFQPRQRLVETDLMAQFGIGRTIVREILKKLEMKGLVRTNRYRGAVVADLNAEEVEAIYFVRALLEKAAARLVIKNIRKEEIQELKKILKELEKQMRKKTNQRFEKDSEFHRGIFRTCGNPCLSEVIDLLHTKAHIVRYNAWFLPQRIEQAIQEHREIIRAIEMKDQSKLERLILKHLKFSKNAYLARWK